MVTGIRLPFDLPEQAAIAEARRLTGLTANDIQAAVCRVSIDARRGQISRVYSVRLDAPFDEKAFAEKLQMPFVRYKPNTKIVIPHGEKRLEHRPGVVGLGPAGLFAAYVLAKHGYRPLVLERGGDVPVDHGGKAVNDHSGIGLHVIFDPVEHQADKGVLVDRRDEGLVLVTHAHALRLLLDHALEQIVGDLVEVVFHLLAADGVVDVHNEWLVVLHGLKELQKTLLPRLVGLVACERLAGVLLTRPFDKVVNVLEVVIKGHAVDAAVLGDVVDGDLVERLLQQQIFERRLERAFGHL